MGSNYSQQWREDKRARGLCTRCGKENALPGRAHGQICTNKRRQWRSDNRDNVLETLRNWQAKHRREVRGFWLKQQYGITLADYDQMLHAQSSVCALCGGTETRNGSKGNLVVDHDHVTGRVRGLLCSKCNLKLAAVEDSRWLEQALSYAQRVGRFESLARNRRRKRG